MYKHINGTTLWPSHTVGELVPCLVLLGSCCLVVYVATDAKRCAHASLRPALGLSTERGRFCPGIPSSLLFLPVLIKTRACFAVRVAIPLSQLPASLGVAGRTGYRSG